MNQATANVKKHFTCGGLRFACCAAALLCFLGGLSIYLFFRNRNIVFFKLIPKSSLLDTFYLPVGTDPLFMSMLLFNVPDGLWFLSGLLAIRAIWLTNKKWRSIYFCLFSAIAVLMETLQISDFFPGTFDVLDLVIMAFCAFVESITFNMLMRRRVV